MNTKVVGLSAILCVLFLNFMVAPVAASGVEKIPNRGRWAWDFTPQVFHWGPNWGNLVPSDRGLEYGLSFAAETGELHLFVHNPTKKTIILSQPTALMADFTLLQKGQVVWRASTNRDYAQVVTTDRFKPGEAKVYKEALPRIPPGDYLAQAYYLSESKVSPVASTYIKIKSYRPDGLDGSFEYSIEYMAPTLMNPSPRLRLVVKNLSDKTITLPYQFGYQVLIRKAGSSDYLPNVGMGQSLGTMEGGASRYLFVNLSGLEPGVYEVDVRSNISHLEKYTVVAQIRFRY